ncbi:Uu.00g061200.m01.CDS01 [Anthostomella pinea]|uniref:Uu.00g061200.m01.CDS01 n=1 Tax=Anthostomella pinea TaxID=933095 RepID=A0AAI8YMN0_9PEZI|nr:Uu.00g061200.m01.CDS01 [Anthostomella pinea]
MTATETLPAPALTIEVARRSEDVTAPPSTTLQPFDNIVDESMPASAEPEYPTGAKFYIIYLRLSQQSPITFTLSPILAGTSSAYRLPLCAFQFFFGKLYKIFSVKRVMLASVRIFLLGSLLCAATATSKMFVFGRAVAGLGCAGILAGCFTLLVQILPLRLRPLYTGLFGGIETVAVVVAPKAIFAQLDLLGSTLFVPAITSLFLALSWAGTKYAFDSPLVLCLYAAFAILIAGFAWDQYRKQDAALLSPRIFRRRSIIAGFIFSFCCNGSLNIINYYMPTYLQVVREYSPATSGYLMVPIIVGFLIGMLMHGAGTMLTGFYTPFMLAGSVLMPLAAGLVTTWTLDSGLAKLITYSGLPDGPLGLSVILFAQHFGPALFVSVAQTIFTNRLAVSLHAVAPQLDAKAIEQMGLGQLKSSIGPQKLQDVLLGFDRSLVQTWYLPLGLACATAVGSLMMEWRSVKEKRS